MPNVTIIWKGDTLGISANFALNLMLQRMGTRVIQMGKRTVPYIGPTYPYLIQTQDDTYGGILYHTWVGMADIYVSDGVTDVGPFGSIPLADVYIDDGQEYKLWYRVRTTPWPPRPINV